MTEPDSSTIDMAALSPDAADGLSLAYRRPLLALLAAACACYFVGVGAGVPVNNAELRCVEINQHMLQAGDLLVPMLHGQPHLTKPPLFHWLAWGIARGAGVSSLAAVRAVSGIAATGTLLLVYLLGREMASPETGWRAALVCLSTYGLLEYAHRGMFDSLLTAFVCLSLLGGWQAARGEPRAWLWLLLGLAGGFMVKGPMAWLAPAPPLLWLAWPHRREPRLWLAAAGLALAVLALCLPWYAYLIARVPEARETLRNVITVNFGAKSGDAAMAFHGQPVYYYLGALPEMLLPWSPLALWLGRDLWRRRHGRDRLERLCLLWLLVGLAVLCLVPAKAARYLLPLLPAWALLLGHRLAAMPVLGRRSVRVLAGLLLLLALALPVWLWCRLGEPVALAALVGLAMAVGAVLLWRDARPLQPPRLLLLAAVLTALISPFLYGRWLPSHRELTRTHDSPAYRAYQARVHALESLFRSAP